MNCCFFLSFCLQTKDLPRYTLFLATATTTTMVWGRIVGAGGEVNESLAFLASEFFVYTAAVFSRHGLFFG